ncbi:phage holin, LLH family [Dielma fastidiosa]|uniref:phage holin, LLH family n=1 Tax=Dielma fastidiosa TaxID=1034346 RepID=UPI001C7173B9|nr:phage holin, LLH family [Dielma fastidiosa]
MMEYLINNWFMFVALLAVLFICFLAIRKWLGKPSAEQIANVKEWLLLAVTEAEKQLGGGTGQLKLRFVYDWAVERFSWVSVIPFDTFAGWVDEALAEMKKQLEVNNAVKAYVEGE